MDKSIKRVSKATVLISSSSEPLFSQAGVRLIRSNGDLQQVDEYNAISSVSVSSLESCSASSELSFFIGAPASPLDDQNPPDDSPMTRFTEEDKELGEEKLSSETGVEDQNESANWGNGDCSKSPTILDMMKKRMSEVCIFLVHNLTHKGVCICLGRKENDS